MITYITIIILLILIVLILFRKPGQIEEPFYTLFLPYYDPEVAGVLVEDKTKNDIKIIISASQWRFGVFRVLMRILIGNGDINIGQIHLESMEKDKDVLAHIDSHPNHMGVVPSLTLVEYYKNRKNIRMISSVFENYIFFITQADNDIIYLDDLENKKIGVGKKGSMWNLCANELMTDRGYPYKPYYSDSVEDMANQLHLRKIDAIVVTDRYPSQILNYLFYNFFTFTLVQIKKTEKIPFYYRTGQIDLTEVRANFVPKITSDNKYLFFNSAMDVYKFPNYMVCNKDNAKDVVYRMTEFLFKNAELMQKDPNPFIYIDIPLHEGAIEYYYKSGYMTDYPVKNCVFSEGKIQCDDRQLAEDKIQAEEAIARSKVIT